MDSLDSNIQIPVPHLRSPAAAAAATDLTSTQLARRPPPPPPMSHPVGPPVDRHTMTVALATANRHSGRELESLDAMLFDGQEGTMAAFLRRICERPITIGSGQYDFYEAMNKRGCFISAQPRHSYSSPPIVQLHIVHIEDPQMRFGTYSFDLVAFICGLAAFLLSDDLKAGVESLLQVPSEIAKAFLLFTPSEYSCFFPARRWFMQRFFRPDCDDYNCWIQTNNLTSLIRNEQFIDLMYLSSQQRELANNQLPLDCRQALSVAMATCPSVTTPHEFRETFSIRHLASARNPATIMTFFTLFINRMMHGLPQIMMFQSISEGLNKARNLFELAYAMLLGWPLGDIEITAAQLPDELLQLIDNVVEEMRSHLDTSSDFTRSQNAFINRIVASSDEFARRWFNELQIRRAVTDDVHSRKKLMVNYVNTEEELFETFVKDIFQKHRPVQLRMLNDWISTLPEHMRPDIALVLSREASSQEYRTGVNSFFTVLRLPASAHLHKMKWTLAFFERIGRFFPANMYALTSTDAQGPYIVMPRQIMNILRVVMTGDALTSPNYPKTVAAWPLLALFWVSRRVDQDEKTALDCGLETPMADVSIDSVSAATVLGVLAHWLYVPMANASHAHAGGNTDRVGVPAMDTPSFEFVRLMLHRIVDMLFAHVDLAEDVDMGLRMGELNAVRSFIMISSCHYISCSSIDTIIDLLHVKGTKEHERDLLEVLCAIREVNSPPEPRPTDVAASSASVNGRKRGALSAELSHTMAEPEPSYADTQAPARRPRGRPSAVSAGKAAVEPVGRRISLAVVNGVNADEVVSRISVSNPYASATTESGRNSLVNHWLYEFLLAHGTRYLLMDFVVQSQINRVTFNKPMYVCSHNAVRAWADATEYVAHHLSPDNAAYHRHRYQLRWEYAEEGGRQRYHQLVMFLRRLEAHVCMINTSASSSSSSSSSQSAATGSAYDYPSRTRGSKPAAVRAMPNIAEPTTAREAELIRCLEEFYNKKDFTHPVPTAACYSGGRFVMLPFDRALTMVGVVPWRQGSSVHPSQIFGDDDAMLPAANDASAENSLSSVSIGNAALLCGTLNEFKVANKVEPHGVFNSLMLRKARMEKSSKLHHQQHPAASDCFSDLAPPGLLHR